MKSVHSNTIVVALFALSLGGCVTQSVIVEPRGEAEARVEEQERRIEHHFEPAAGRGPAEISALRAAAPPANPEVVRGKNLAADQHALGSRGFVSIGKASYALTDRDAESKARELGRELGADQILIYEEMRTSTNEQEPARFVANYYVKFKLLFGATFRNLTASEKERLGGESGVQIGSVIGGTPASQANLMTGDFVLRLNGKSFRDRTEFQELLRAQAGKPVTLMIRRGDVTLERPVRLGAMPATN